MASVLALGIAVGLPSTQLSAGTAFFAKIIPDVNHKAGTAEWVPAKPTGIISAGDKVSTGAKGLAVIKFLDKSIVKVKENSELVVTGSVDESRIVKEVDVQKGVIGFIIGKQEGSDQFRFTSPTSVAAIRGTHGAFSVRGEADTLIVTEGMIRLTNVTSGDSLDVASGFTGISRPNGTLEVRASTPEEQASAQETGKWLHVLAGPSFEEVLKGADQGPKNGRYRTCGTDRMTAAVHEEGTAGSDRGWCK